MEEALKTNQSLRALASVLDVALPPPVVEAPDAAATEAALQRVLTLRAEAHDGEATHRVVSLDAYRRRWRVARRLAAAGVVLAAGAGLFWRAVTKPAAGGGTNAPAIFATATGVIDTVRLPDGSVAVLGPASELALSAEYGSTARELTLRGQAHFDVVHDAARPFVVRAASAVFRDVGTGFDVQSDAPDGARIVVTEGAVAIQQQGKFATVLRAGDRATVSATGAARVERNGATADDVAWAAGLLVFRDAPITHVSAELRRWFGLTLVMKSDALAARRLTATFDRAAAADVGRVIAATLGGAARRSGDTLFIMHLSSSTLGR